MLFGGCKLVTLVSVRIAILAVIFTSLRFILL